MEEYQDIISNVVPFYKSQVRASEEPLFFLLIFSLLDHFYTPAGNITGKKDSEKHMVTVLTTILSSENSSSFCQFLDGCYCTNNPMKIVSCDLIKRCGLHEDFIAVTYGCLHLKLALNDLYLQVPLEFRRSRG